MSCLESRFSSKADLKELIDGDYSALIPSFGVYYNYKVSLNEEKFSTGMVEQGWNQSNVNISTAAAPMGNGLWAIGGGLNIPLGVVDKISPDIELQIDGFRFIPEKRKILQKTKLLRIKRTLLMNQTLRL